MVKLLTTFILFFNEYYCVFNQFDNSPSNFTMKIQILSLDRQISIGRERRNKLITKRQKQNVSLLYFLVLLHDVLALVDLEYRLQQSIQWGIRSFLNQIFIKNLNRACIKRDLKVFTKVTGETIQKSKIPASDAFGMSPVLSRFPRSSTPLLIHDSNN